jgi:hypothetical protein
MRLTTLCVAVLGLYSGVSFECFCAELITAESRVFASAESVALHLGVYEAELRPGSHSGNPFFEIRATVTFTRPDGSTATADAFYDGNGIWKARAYCDQAGRWTWHSKAKAISLNGISGHFEVAASDLPGKLRKHPDDPFQFARDDGSWFLHIGDTGYRYVVDAEPKWREYVDQAAEAGFTKIRTWFAQSRSTVEALYAQDRSALDLDYWQEIDHRLIYALRHHPHVVFQLMPYAEDTQEIRRYASRDPMSVLIGRAAQARWSAFPNVYWSISNDREVVDEGPLKGRMVLRSTIDRIGHDFAKREPWGTLLTNHQCRFSGYAFVDAPWSDVITLEDLDQVHGEIIAEYRKLGSDPIVNDEDRYELYRNAANRRYFFRRLMWSSLLSGGHATYGGLKTYEAYDGGPSRGVQGYFDANRDGTLFQGAHDFQHIHRFFDESNLTMVGLTPDDGLVGGDPLRLKCARDGDTILVYLANPTGDNPETDNPGIRKPSVSVDLPNGNWNARWFNPRSGEWLEGKPFDGGASHKLTVPYKERSSAGDWVLLLLK